MARTFPISSLQFPLFAFGKGRKFGEPHDSTVSRTPYACMPLGRDRIGRGEEGSSKSLSLFCPVVFPELSTGWPNLEQCLTRGTNDQALIFYISFEPKGGKPSKILLPCAFPRTKDRRTDGRTDGRTEAGSMLIRFRLGSYGIIRTTDGRTDGRTSRQFSGGRS